MSALRTLALFYILLQAHGISGGVPSKRRQMTHKISCGQLISCTFTTRRRRLIFLTVAIKIIEPETTEADVIVQL